MFANLFVVLRQRVLRFLHWMVICGSLVWGQSWLVAIKSVMLLTSVFYECCRSIEMVVGIPFSLKANFCYVKATIRNGPFVPDRSLLFVCGVSRSLAFFVIGVLFKFKSLPGWKFSILLICTWNCRFSWFYWSYSMIPTSFLVFPSLSRDFMRRIYAVVTL